MELSELQSGLDEIAQHTNKDTKDLLIGLQADVGEFGDMLMKKESFEDAVEEADDSEVENSEERLEMTKKMVQDALEGRVGSMVVSLALISSQLDADLDEVVETTIEQTKQGIEARETAQVENGDEDEPSPIGGN